MSTDRWPGSKLPWGLLLPLVFLPGAMAQETETPSAAAPAAVFGETVDVELVNVRVWVEDRKGRPVSGLGAEDFEVRLDGRPQAISHFSEVRQGRVRRQDEGEVVDVVELADPASRSASADTGGRLVIYLDEVHLSTGGRRRVVEDLRQLVTGGQVAAKDILILHQAARLHRPLPFGSSESELDSALADLLEPATGGRMAPLEKQLTVDRLWQMWEAARQLSERDPCQSFVNSALGEIQIYARGAGARAQVTLGHLEDTASFLGGLPGGKILLYVGDILEINPGEDLMQMVSGLCPLDREAVPSQIAGEELSRRFNRLAEHANAGRVTFYTLQARGLRANPVGGPDQQATDIRAANTFQHALRRAEQGGFEQMAMQTGGKALLNRNRFERQLEAMADDLESYYSLAFPPPPDATAASRLDIEVRGRGLQVRHRDSIQVKTTRQQMRDRVLSAIHLGESPNPLAIGLASGALRRQGELFVLPLHIRVPAGRVTYLPSAEGAVASLEAMVTARSPEHPALPPQTRLFRFAKPELEVGVADLVVELELAEGIYVLGVGVRDQASSEQSFVSTTIAVGQGSEP